MSNRDLKLTGTHITNLKGSIIKSATNPVVVRVAGLKAGQLYFNTSTKDIYFYISSTWLGVHTTAA